MLALLAAAAVMLPDTRVESLRASGGIDYRLEIGVPPDFETSSARYPVVLLLDADYSFPLAEAIATHLRERRDLPDLLLVAISYGVADYKLNRTRDYTPTHVATGGYGPQYQPSSGGGPAFAAFIEKELLPFLSTRYRAEPQPVLVGHSYGGLFAWWALLERPGLLRGAIAVSASLWYDDRLIERIEAKLTPERRLALRGRVYAAAGDQEDPQMPGDLRRLAAQMTKARYPLFDARFDVLDGETHNSIFPRALSNGLRYFWPRGSFTPSQAPGTRKPGE